MFRALWIAQFASNVGTWMQTVGAQWLLIDRSPLLVSLVQTASSLPIVLLALPAGAFADVVDRRRLLLGAQVAMFVAAAALAAATFLGATSPALILGLTFALGCGTAIVGARLAGDPARPRRPLAAAAGGGAQRAEHEPGPRGGAGDRRVRGGGGRRGLGVRAQRGVVRRHRDRGAELAGARAGRHRPARTARSRRCAPGGRYVRNALIVRRLLYRAVLFIPAASAVWALLPVVAATRLGLGSGGYGLLLGMVGIGAVAGAVVIPRVRAKVGSARLVTGAMVVTALCLAVVATVGNEFVVGAALLPVGGSWIAVMSSLNSSLQLALPNWVRARGLAYYLVVFQGAQALAAVVWGTVADHTSVTVALLAAAVTLAVGAVVGLRARCRTPRSWTGPRRRTGRPRS